MENVFRFCLQLVHISSTSTIATVELIKWHAICTKSADMFVFPQFGLQGLDGDKGGSHLLDARDSRRAILPCLPLWFMDYGNEVPISLYIAGMAGDNLQSGELD